MFRKAYPQRYTLYKNSRRPGLHTGPRQGTRGRLQPHPDAVAGGEEDWLPPVQLLPAVGPLDLASTVPHAEIVSPLDSDW